MLLSTLRNLMFRPRSRPTGLRRGRPASRPLLPRLLLEALESRELLSGIPPFSGVTQLLLAGQGPTGPLRPADFINSPSPIGSTSSTAANVNTDGEGGAGSAPHNETTIAVNPTNSLNMIGSANDYQNVMPTGGVSVFFETLLSRAHVTFDGGHTWTTYPINFHGYNFTGDPAVAFDADGTAYLATLGFVVPQTFATGISTSPDVLVAHSTDGGQSWSDPVRVASGKGSTATFSASTFLDKDYVAAWGHGNAIVTWTQFNYGAHGVFLSAPIFASLTHDGGNTWTSPVQISGPFVNDGGSVPVVAADGSIHVAFLSFDEEIAPEFRDHYKVVKVDPSTGQALGAPVEVGLVFDGVHDYPINVLGRQTYQDSEFRTNPLGNLTADPTNALHLALVWSDMRNNPGGLLTSTDPYQVKTNSDIIVSQSFDGGKTWSAPTALAIPNDQFQPWGAYSPSGLLQIGFYDRSYDPANHQYGYTLASETAPGSLTFTEQQLTTQLSDPTQVDAFFSGPFFGGTVNSNFPNATTFMGDYSGIAVSPTGVDALWTDMRVPSSFPGFPGSSEDAFFADPPAPLAALAELPGQNAAMPRLDAAGASKTQPRPPDGSIPSLSFLRTSVPWASLTSNLPTPSQSSDATPAMTRSAIWSLDPASVQSLLADSNQADEPLVSASAMHPTSTLPDDGSADALGDNPVLAQWSWI